MKYLHQQSLPIFQRLATKIFANGTYSFLPDEWVPVALASLPSFNVEEVLDMETFCFCTAGDVHGDDYDLNYDDLDDGDVVDNDDVVVDNVEQERDLACVKLGDVLSAVARGQRKNKPNEWVNAVLHKLSRIGVTYTTIL